MHRFHHSPWYTALVTILVTCFAAFWAFGPDLTPRTVILPGNTPQALNQAEFLGHSDPKEKIDVVIGLKIRNETDLDKLLSRQADPKSPDFRKFLTPAQFEQSFSPTQKDLDKVVKNFKKHGITIVSVSANRLLIHARGTVAQFEKAFKVNINVYKLRSEMHFSNDRDPSIPADLSDVVESVIGLNTFARFHSNVKGAFKPHSSTPVGYSPKDIAGAYNYPNANNNGATAKYTGKGVTIAIATAYKYDPKDTEAFWKQFGITRTGKVIDTPIGGNATENNGETTLDLQQIGAQAPGADIVMYMGKDPSFVNFTLVFNQIVQDNKADVVSISWGMNEEGTGSAQMRTEHNLFKQGNAQGMAFFAASGDDGAYDDQDKVGTYAVDYPSSDPYVTAVGGTALTLKTDGSRKDESAWSGAGGGISQEFDRPSWQVGPGVPTNDKRNSADIGLVADPATGYAIYFESQWDQSGGTSFAAPNWAALWGLATEANGGRLGPANPTLYRAAQTAGYGNLFFDVASGNNGNGQGPGYNAVTTWDYPTGWGTPNGVNLIQWLVNDKPIAADPAKSSPSKP